LFGDLGDGPSFGTSGFPSPEAPPGLDDLDLDGPTPLVAREAAAAAPGFDVPEELQKALEEVETYMGLGFVEDAKVALRDIAGRHPGHPAIQAKLEDLGLDASALDAPPPAEPEASLGLDDLVGEPDAPAVPAASQDDGGGMLDLSSELSDLFGAQDAVDPNIVAITGESGDASLSDILRQFKKGVDQQLSHEDYDTRYNLGIAYKEMNLLDEAIAEFQKAAKDEARTLECSSMLGICFLEKGMPALAVKWFEKGLLAEGRLPQEYQGLRYDLALAHEAVGDSEKALALFTELYGQDATFRDVATRVQELRAAQG
jgi:tetratricopeptide (TPR) repeat protein